MVSNTAMLALALVLFAIMADGKRMTQYNDVQAKGKSYTIRVLTSKQCRLTCENDSHCDLASYDVATNKCRIFLRCSHTEYIKANNSVLYVKRPLIYQPGFVYHPESDSCIKLIKLKLNYNDAQHYCEARNGRLIGITDEKINKVATEFLKQSEEHFAWIGLTNSGEKDAPVLPDGRKVSETSYFPTRDKFFRRDRSYCWSMYLKGYWVEHLCRNSTYYSICQILAY